MLRFFLSLIIASHFGYAQLVVVASQESTLTTLTQKEVSRIFLAKTNRLPNRAKASPLELNNQDYKAKFYRTISGKNLNQLHSYWTTLIFTGRGKPPKSTASIEVMKELLAQNQNAIAYLPAELVDSSMKVLLELP